MSCTHCAGQQFATYFRVWHAGDAGMISMKSMVRPGELTGNEVVPLFSVRLPWDFGLDTVWQIGMSMTIF